MSKTTNKFAPEVRERAVRMVADHERDHPSRWAAVVSIAEKIGCVPHRAALERDGALRGARSSVLRDIRAIREATRHHDHRITH